MKKRNFRTEIFQLSNENLVLRIEKLKDRLLTHLGLGDGNYIERHSIYRTRRMLDYAESVLEKRLKINSSNMMPEIKNIGKVFEEFKNITIIK